MNGLVVVTLKDGTMLRFANVTWLMATVSRRDGAPGAFEVVGADHNVGQSVRVADIARVEIL